MAEARSGAIFVAAADLHLGRPIASLPDALREEAKPLGPFGALDRLVDLALEHRADALLLAGDVVDDDGAYFEVFDALGGALRRLDGIPVYAIAGNHDSKVLPGLARALDGLTLLGEHGVWESASVPTAAGAVEVLGWSFPSAHCKASPFDTPPPPRAGRRLALLHGDLDASASVYAPFTSAHLRTHAADAWLLGHVHAPSFGRPGGPSPAGYLGSVCGLDPSEAGPRGAWLVRLGASGVEFEHRAIAPLAWATVEAHADAVSPEGLDAAVQRLADGASEAFEAARAVGVRVALAGEHERWLDIARATGELRLGQPWTHRGRRVFIDQVACRLTAPLPLERLSCERSVAGRIAALILELQGGGGERLVREAAERFESVALDRGLRVPELGERRWPLPDARATLLREARAALGELLTRAETR